MDFFERGWHHSLFLFSVLRRHSIRAIGCLLMRLNWTNWVKIMADVFFLIVAIPVEHWSQYARSLVYSLRPLHINSGTMMRFWLKIHKLLFHVFGSRQPITVGSLVVHLFPSPIRWVENLSFSYSFVLLDISPYGHFNRSSTVFLDI